MAFHDPISTSQPSFFAQTNKITSPGRYSSAHPRGWWGPNISFPYPTNAWFEDFILPGNDGMVVARTDRRTTVLPYSVRATDGGLQFCYPFIRRYPDGRTLRNEHAINYHPTATNWGWTSESSPVTWRLLDLQLGAVEAFNQWFLDRFDELTATLRWQADNTRFAEAPIVKGMPYVTMRYNGLTPKLSIEHSDFHAIRSVNGQTPGVTLSGTRFELKINRPYLGTDATETWVVYASSNISLTFSADGFTASGAYTGYLRIAYAPGGSSDAVTLLDRHAAVIPTAGSAKVTVSGDTATTEFNYTTIGGDNLLLYALPHHEATLVNPSRQPGLKVTTLRGTLSAVSGRIWQMRHQLSTITWRSPNQIDSDKRAAIQAALDAEKNLQAYNLDSPEAYWFGKQIARASRLALIADELGDSAARDSILSKMKEYINPWFDRNAATDSSRSLMYDTSWGGVIDAGAYNLAPAGDPPNANQGFGNAVYNDHYFHWGYFIYAAAVIAHFDNSWANTYKTRVNDMIRDIANPSMNDPHFTQLRHYDWFEGHSWAAGLQPNGDGRNQESTSEAVNAWYGINLWGLATNQSDIRNVGRFLQAMETQTAQLYWQMPSTNSVYPADFASQKVIPLLFANKVFNGTWFGMADDILVGIEMLPFTPASHELLPKAWMRETYDSILSAVATPATAFKPGGWLGYTYAAQAIIDPDTAFNNIQALQVTNDNQYIDSSGASKTNLLWWSAVQKLSVPPTPTPGVGGLPGSNLTSRFLCRADTILQTEGRVGVNDQDYTVQAGQSLVAVSALSASRTITLPNNVPTGYIVTVKDETGSCSSSRTITIAGRINGANNLVLSEAFAGVVLMKTPSGWLRIQLANAGTDNLQAASARPGSSGDNLSSRYRPYVQAAVALGSYRKISSNAALTATDGVVAVSDLSESITINLPAQPRLGQMIEIGDVTGNCSSSRTITIKGTIDGQTSTVLNSPYATISCYYNGVNWSRV